jgi:hypothetical protein
LQSAQSILQSMGTHCVQPNISCRDTVSRRNESAIRSRSAFNRLYIVH